MTPLGRISTPEDVSRVVVDFIEAEMVTGQTLLVDGGLVRG
jgi:NAD(P)-dependent dehydrogenase (short-subunit alcohol dehydrogenase family)